MSHSVQIDVLILQVQAESIGILGKVLIPHRNDIETVDHTVIIHIDIARVAFLYGTVGRNGRHVVEILGRIEAVAQKAPLLSYGLADPREILLRIEVVKIRIRPLVDDVVIVPDAALNRVLEIAGMAEHLERSLVTAIGHFAAVTPAGIFYAHRERQRTRILGKNVLTHIVEIIEHQVDVVEEGTFDRDIGLIRLVPSNERVSQYILVRTSD